MAVQDTLRLNDKQLKGWVILDAQTVHKAPPILHVPINEISNQKKIPLVIRVSMIWGPQDSLHIPKKIIDVGNFSIFPPDQIGVYSLRTSGVFEQLAVSPEEIEEGKTTVALMFEMAPVSEEKDLKNVEVLIAPVRWKME